VNPYLWKPALAATGVISPREPGEKFEESREHGFHTLRHLFASLVLSGGANNRELSDYLGHADPGFTLRIYVHMMPTSDQKMREAIDSVWNAVDGPSDPQSVPSARPAGEYPPPVQVMALNS
jgi:hypothetical protein